MPTQPNASASRSASTGARFGLAVGKHVDAAARITGLDGVPALAFGQDAAARGLPLAPVQAAIGRRIEGRLLGFIGQPRIAGPGNHHSAKLPSGLRHTGLRHRCGACAASRTAASSISIPSPGPSGIGKLPSTGVSGVGSTTKL